MKNYINTMVCCMAMYLTVSSQTTHPINNIAFFLQPNVEVLDFAGPLEVFTIAGFNTYTVSIKKEPMQAMGVLTVVPDYDLDDCPQPDILAFFGGGDPRGLSKDSSVMDWIQSKLKKTPLQFSVCTGAYFLGEAGYLDNQYATTYHLVIDDLQSMYPKSKVKSDVRFVDNGEVITTAGISAGIDGALHVVAKVKGNLHARHVAKAMEYDKWVPNEGFITAHPFVDRVLEEGLDASLKYLEDESIYKGELLNLSEMLMKQNRWEEAEKCIVLALDMGDPNAKDYELLRRSYQGQGKFAPPSQEEYFDIIRNEGVEKAEQILSEVKDKYSDWLIVDPMQFLHLSYLEHYRKGDFDGAIRIMELQLKHFPDYVYGHYWMGRYYEDKGMVHEALQYFQKAHNLDRSFEEAEDKVSQMKEQISNE